MHHLELAQAAEDSPDLRGGDERAHERIFEAL